MPPQWIEATATSPGRFAWRIWLAMRCAVSKDIIISGGENISTIEVEQAILRHPDVLECAVVSIPDEKWGEVPKAFVTPRPGAALTADEVIEHCRSVLAHFKCPKAVEFGVLPKTSTGKVQKFVLREREWAGRDRRIN